MKSTELDGNMRVGELKGNGYEEALAKLVGSTVEVVRSQIKSASKTMTLGVLFEKDWPDRHTEVGNWTVDFAFERLALEEIADEFGLSFKTVERRLEKAGRDEKVSEPLKSR